MLLKLNDKLLHFLACLAITLTAGELCAVTAGGTKDSLLYTLFAAADMWMLLRGVLS